MSGDCDGKHRLTLTYSMMETKNSAEIAVNVGWCINYPVSLQTIYYR